MKKILLGATALSMIGFAGAAGAQEWSARTGGFFISGVGYVDSDNHDSGMTIVSDGEVTFNFSIVADNGLTFSTKFELEGTGVDENMDEYVASVAGSFGTLQIGREDGAMDRRMGAAAGATSFTAAADATGLLFDWNSTAAPGVVDTDGTDTGDTLKITYYTPTFSGFSAGVSVAPGCDSVSAGDSGRSTDPADNDCGGAEVGAAYSNDFGSFSLSVGAGYTYFFDEDGRGVEDSYGLSANVGFGGFTVGGVYGFTNNKGSEEDAGFGIGADYATGPWLFGVQYAQGLDASDDTMGISVGVDYALAPGVTVGAIGEYANNDDDATNNGDEDAFAVGAFMGFDF